MRAVMEPSFQAWKALYSQIQEKSTNLFYLLCEVEKPSGFGLQEHFAPKLSCKENKVRQPS